MTRLGLGLVVLEVPGQPLGHHGLRGRPGLGVAELGLGLPLELGVLEADAYDGGQPLPDVLPGQVGLGLLQEAVLPGVVVYDPGEGGAEPGDVGPALLGVDAVGEGQHGLGEAVVVLQGELDGGLVHGLLEVAGQSAGWPSGCGSGP